MDTFPRSRPPFFFSAMTPSAGENGRRTNSERRSSVVMRAQNASSARGSSRIFTSLQASNGLIAARYPCGPHGRRPRRRRPPRQPSPPGLRFISIEHGSRTNTGAGFFPPFSSSKLGSKGRTSTAFSPLTGDVSDEDDLPALSLSSSYILSIFKSEK